MNPILVKIAEQSPKEYADRILKRNTTLLEKLMIIKPYIGKGRSIPFDILNNVIVLSKHGCPYYTYVICSVNCLWRKYSNCHNSCMNVPFSYGKRKGITLKEVSNLQTVSIAYHYDSEIVSCVTTNISRKDFNMCVDFVKAHIEWAKLPIWGSNYKRCKNDSI